MHRLIKWPKGKWKLKLHCLWDYETFWRWIGEKGSTFSSTVSQQVVSWHQPVYTVQFSSVAQLCPTLATPWIAARQASLSTNSRSLLKPMSIELVMPSSHLILCCPLLPPIPPSIRVFSNESTLHMRWPKYCSFSFSITVYTSLDEIKLRNRIVTMRRQKQLHVTSDWLFLSTRYTEWEKQLMWECGLDLTEPHCLWRA